MHAPKDLLKLYGHMNRIRSSRGLERESKRNLEVLWLKLRLYDFLEKKLKSQGYSADTQNGAISFRLPRKGYGAPIRSPYEYRPYWKELEPGRQGRLPAIIQGG